MFHFKKYIERRQWLKKYYSASLFFISYWSFFFISFSLSSTSVSMLIKQTKQIANISDNLFYFQKCHLKFHPSPPKKTHFSLSLFYLNYKSYFDAFYVINLSSHILDIYDWLIQWFISHSFGVGVRCQENLKVWNSKICIEN